MSLSKLKNLKSRIIPKTVQRIEVCVFCLLLTSCNLFDKTNSSVTNYITMSDTEPPVLQEVQSVNSKQVRLVFNEEVQPYENSFAPNIVEVEGYSLLITLSSELRPGIRVMLEGRVRDNVGNSSGIKTPVWGYNDNLAEAVINEFSTRGEGNNPDRTELKVMKEGSLAGVVLYNGIPGSWDSMVMLEDIQVNNGDFIVVWWTQSLPDGVKDSDGVYNVCAKTDVNLPGYNGVLTLCVSPAQGAEVIDCVVYSNNSSTYEGYGSKTTLERVRKAELNEWWKDIGNPVDSTDSTATRTMCRKADGTGWYVCETKGASFGKENTASEYVNRVFIKQQ